MPPGGDVQRRPNKAAGGSLIFIGAFNPSIFQPAWFMRHELIPDDEDSVDVEAITKQITSWGQSWLKVVVQPERCEFHATDDIPTYKVLEDLALGVFTLLHHVPITAFGVNKYVHFQVEAEEAWNKLGFDLFAVGAWKGLLDDPRLLTLQVQDRRAEEDGAMIVTVQPSSQFKSAVFVATNDHFAIDNEATDAATAMERLADVFDDSMSRSDTIIDGVKGL